MELRENRPSYVRFETQTIEDRAATLANGNYTEKNVDMVIITPIGSKDEIPMFVADWLTQLETHVREERIPRKWRDQYKEAYEAWKKGQEIPLNGTPIKGWSLLSPAQQNNIIAANIRTVEDLATANGEALQRIGMGGQELKQRAEAWLKAAAGAGVLVQENTLLRAKVKQLEHDNAGLLARNQELAGELASLRNAVKAPLGAEA